MSERPIVAYELWHLIAVLLRVAEIDCEALGKTGRARRRRRCHPDLEGRASVLCPEPSLRWLSCRELPPENPKKYRGVCTTR